MNVEKNKGPESHQSIGNVKPRIKDVGQTIWVVIIALVVITAAFVLKGYNIIGQQGFTWILACTIVAVLVLAVVGQLAVVADESGTDARMQKQIDALTPNTLASQKLATMSFEDMLADAEQYKPKDDDN